MLPKNRVTRILDGDVNETSLYQEIESGMIPSFVLDDIFLRLCTEGGYRDLRQALADHFVLTVKPEELHDRQMAFVRAYAQEDTLKDSEDW